MMKKLGMLALVILLVSGLAIATAEVTVLVTEQNVEWLRFEMDEGSMFYQYGDEKRPAPPKELEAMYRWMEQGAQEQEIIFVRMPAGRALLSACRSDIGTALSAQELYGMWPQIAEALSRGTLYLNSDPSCVSIEELGGAEWMHVQTMAVLDGEKMLSVELEGYFICDDGQMVELWFASPAASTYLYDDAASAELRSDRQSLQNVLGTVQRPGVSQSQETAPVQGTGETAERPAQSMLPSEKQVRYEDPEGKFSLSLPENMMIIPPNELRAKMLTAQRDVGDAALLGLYRYWLKNAERDGNTLFVDPNYGNAMLIHVDESSLIVSLEEIEDMEPVIAANLSREVGEMTRQLGPERGRVAGENFTSFSYTGKYLGQDVSVLIMLSLRHGTLHEIDIWEQRTGVNEAWSDAILKMLLSLSYEEVNP